MARRWFVSFLLLALPAAMSYPVLWVNDMGNKAAECLKHPTGKICAHGAPVLDKTATFVVKTGGVLVKGGAPLCPGTTYSVTVTWATKRLALFTTKFGVINPAGPCTGRLVTTKPNLGTSYTFNWAIPAGASGSDTLRVTSNFSPSGNFQQASLPYTISPAGCGTKGR